MYPNVTDANAKMPGCYLTGTVLSDMGTQLPREVSMFCEALLAFKYCIRLRTAQTNTIYLYITRKNSGRMFQARFANHPGNKSNEAYDYILGSHKTFELAATVRDFFK